ncbi:MAG: hypothetical protein AAB681_00660 [Patescibacteria group bacterium]
MKNLLFTISASWRIINQFLFGSRCAGCHRPGPAICEKCLLLIPLSDITEHDGIYGLYDYGNPIVSHSIWNLKYRHRGQEAKLLALKASELISEIVAEHLQSEKPETIILVPVPQYKKKTQKRGFNQSEAIAQWITKVLPDSKIENVLEKITETLPQSHISDKKQRIKNISETMRMKNPPADGRKIYIVIDDVTTTGATFLEATRALHSAGARNILCIALAHGYKRR